MSSTLRFVVGNCCVILLALEASAQNPTRIRESAGDSKEQRFVDSVLAGLTLEEKVGQLNQLSGLGPPTGPGGAPGGIDKITRGQVGSFLNVTDPAEVTRLQHLAVEQSRTHIPLIFAHDVIHGFRTIFPVPLGEASTWDPAAAERSARIAATEAAAAGINWTFAPMVDIARDPRWGRIVEGAGEDPYLGSALAAARVRGFQGHDLRDPTSVAATAKHFAAYGAAEGGRDYNIADVSERTLRDVYLPPFRAAVCAGVETVMASFNEINGIPSHANRHLITDVLRGEWKFGGLLVSDWTGITEMLNHGVAADSAGVARLALDAGVDMDMVSEVYRTELPKVVRAGRVSQKTLDAAVRRVLRLKYRMGLFQNPYRADAARVQAVTLTAEHRAAARAVGRESIVLLQNDRQVLPLSKGVRTLAVIGALASDSAAAIGNWSALGRAEDAVSVLTGIRRAVSPGSTVLYASGASPLSDDSSGVAEAVSVAARADAIVLVLGESPSQSAEAASRASIELPGAQLRLAQAVVAAAGTKPVVAVLMNGRPLALQWLHDHVPAILETWFLGVEHGTATADVLFGDYNPGGKLTTSFPRVTGQVPIYYSHRNTGRPPADEKYTSKYIDVPWTPLYPFGHGLSYTTFRYGAPHLSAASMRPGDSLRVDVDVSNLGSAAGDEVVQLYLRDEVGSVTHPVEELRGFRRVHLGPNETRRISFTIGLQDLAFYDASLARVAEPGYFTVFVGGSSADTQRARFRFETADGRPVRVPERCADRG